MRRVATFGTATPPEVIIPCCLSSPEDLAVDWLGRNLYWTDSQRGVIELSNLAGRERTVIAVVPEALGGPSHIALDPHQGYEYICVCALFC